MPLAAGARLGRYELLAALGAGGMGEVYRARDTLLGRTVAIKVIAAKSTGNAARTERFQREARAISSLSHPHICTLYDFGQEDGTAFLVMEHLEGETLADRLERGPLSIEEVLRYGAEMAEALDAAHRQGVVHRDLKPANVMLTRDGVKLLDFGLAKLGSEGPASHSTESLTQAGIVVGTLPYMAPEQLEGGPVDARTDLYQLGAVLYEMAAGARPFPAKSQQALITAILAAEPPPLAEARPETPEGLERAVARCLAKDPEQRWQSARDLADELRWILDPKGARPAGSRIASRRKIRGGAARIALLAALVFGLGVAGLTVRRYLGGGRLPTAAATEVRVVVLPFENLTRHPADDWLAGALADSLTVGVQDQRPLVVVNRERVVELFGQRSLRDGAHLDADVVRELVRLLRVQYYVQGSYQKVGDEIKVVARLVRADSGAITAQSSLTDRFANILRLEDELARQFTAKLEATSAAHRGRPPTASLDAYQAFSEARTLYAQNRLEDAVNRARAAVDFDAGYAPAWALLSKCYSRLAAPAVLSGRDLEPRRQVALEAARTASELDPSLYDGHIALALAYREMADLEPWRAEAQKAIALNPRLAEAYALMGDTFYTSPVWGCGRDFDADQAVGYYRQALRLDHRSTTAWTNLAGTLQWAGRFGEALEAIDEGLGIVPDARPLHRRRADALVVLGRAGEAEAEIRTGLQGRAPNGPELLALGAIDLAQGRRSEAARRFDAAVAMTPDPWVDIAAAHFYARAGDLARGASHLERAFEKEPACARFVMRSPLFDGHRDKDPIRAALRKHGQLL